MYTTSCGHSRRVAWFIGTDEDICSSPLFLELGGLRAAELLVKCDIKYAYDEVRVSLVMVQ